MQLLPAHSIELEKAIVQAFVNVVEDKEILIQKLWGADECPEEFLPYLASFLSVDFKIYNTLELSEKRAYLKQSIDIHRKKGTLGALRKALLAVDYDTTITEWYENNKAPHTVTVNVRNKLTNQDDIPKPFDLKQVRTIIQQVKNVQTAFSLNITNQQNSYVYSGAASKVTLKIKVGSGLMTQLNNQFQSMNQHLQGLTWLN